MARHKTQLSVSMEDLSSATSVVHLPLTLSCTMTTFHAPQEKAFWKKLFGKIVGKGENGGKQSFLPNKGQI